MRPEADKAGPLRWFRRLGLSTRLVVFSTLLTLTVVAVSFVAFSLEIRRQTCRLLEGVIADQQAQGRETERRRLGQLLRSSALLIDSPTLRAAMETYRVESASGGAPREDLIDTVRREASKVASAIDRDLLVITDDRGRVLASIARFDGGDPAGRDLSDWPVIRTALRGDDAIGEGNLGVLRQGDQLYRLAAAPIVLRGFVIGTLSLGDRLDRQYLDDLRRSFDSEIVLTLGDRLLMGSVATLATDEVAARLRSVRADGAAPSRLVRSGEQDWLTVSTTLGDDERGRTIVLHAMRSLTDATDAANRELFGAAGAIGLVTLLIAGLGGYYVSRTVVHPLRRFVGFLQRVAASGEHGQRFSAPNAGAEMRTLCETYNELIGSLEEHQAQKLQAAQAELERVERLQESEKLAALGRMLSGAAHEINNPLTGVVGNVEMVLAGEALSGRDRERLETVRREGRRIVALVRNLLKVAHREGTQHEPVDLHGVIRGIAELKRHDFHARRVGLVVELADGEAVVQGNEIELQQVLMNLLNNALDALEDGVEDPAVTIRTASSGTHVRLEVADNGPGLADPSRVFEHFYTTKPIGKGTGLGLAITHAIVQRHRGGIEAVSGTHGAVFRIELPLIDASAPVVTAPAAPEVASPAERQAALAARVLVVDDEPSVLELQLAILDSLGASVIGVEDGRAAIERLRETEFDLVISDLRMPGEVSGKDLFRWVQEHRPEAAAQFVFVTGDAIEDQAFLETAGPPCLLKPFTLEEYVDTLRGVIR